jgi:hypothetical protein
LRPIVFSGTDLVLVAALGRIPIYQTVSEGAFWEDRHPQALPGYGKDTPFGGCAETHDLGTVPPKKSGQRL